ncbi:hypothetical protein C8Q80DRAFT_1271098 [Daedaleopsis nitida]|nr:hypothetical protein C8Q80DRAFT_1271098 [Daedaleopsis nitida]
MSSQAQNIPLNSEPHGISCTLVAPTPPTSPNFAATFARAQSMNAAVAKGSPKAKKGNGSK